ncbi:MAG: glycoside hydrolase family 5 protein [Thermomicrobiales bacterium]
MTMTRRGFVSGATAAAVGMVAGRSGGGAAAAPRSQGEFPIGEAPAIVPMPWLRRDGRFFRAEDGRTTILRGVDYAFNSVGLVDLRFDLTNADLDRIASWGMNALRIRLRDARAGYFPSRPAEPGYLEELDRLIARANDRGLYVIVATGGPEDLLSIGKHPEDPLHDCAKFLPGNPAREHWFGYLEGIVRRYRDWPGVVGFDLINEDISYPPEIHDAVFMGPAHQEALARLRAVDDRHVYFQQPAGWDYQGHSVASGYDLGDPNRFFASKWGVRPGENVQRLEEMLGWAVEAGTDLFLAEYNLSDRGTLEVATMEAVQREVLALLDGALISGLRLGYLPAVSGALISEAREEAFWLAEMVRPYPVWIGGVVTSLAWDFDAAKLRLELALDGRGPTELAVSIARTYPGGFIATTAAGDRLTVSNAHDVVAAGALRWDERAGRIVLAAGKGAETLTLLPLDPSVAPERPRARVADLDQYETVIMAQLDDLELPEGAAASLIERLVQSGEFTTEQARCIVEQLADRLEPWQFGLLVGNATLPHTLAESIGQTVYECVEAELGA